MSAAHHTAWILPAKQARSRQTRDRLLHAGRRLLEHGDFDATSVASIAQEAGCSVGAFYVRFQDKEAFYRAVIEAMAASILGEVTSTITAERLAALEPQQALAACVQYWIEQFRSHRGLLVTATKKALRDPDDWNPVRRAGIEIVEHFIAALARRCDEVGSPGFHHRARVGFQIAGGVMLNAVIRQPAALGLDSADLAAWLTEVVRHCIFGDVPGELLAPRSDRPAAMGAGPPLSPIPGRAARS